MIKFRRPKNLAAFLVPLLCVWLGACSTMSTSSRSFNTVVIDPGHGGHDSGARSSYCPHEKYLALDTSLRLQKKLRAAGFKTVMTRSNDRFIPLDTRVKISAPHKNAIFVSVHYNYAKNRAISGVEVFYHDGPSQSIANSVQRELVRLPAVDRGVKFERYRVLRTATMPAILVEGGFLTNPTEGKKLAQASYRDKVSTAIANGLIRHRGKTLPAVSPVQDADAGDDDEDEED